MKAYFLVLVTCTHYFLPVYVNFLLSLSNATYEKKKFNMQLPFIDRGENVNTFA